MNYRIGVYGVLVATSATVVVALLVLLFVRGWDPIALVLIVANLMSMPTAYLKAKALKRGPKA